MNAQKTMQKIFPAVAVPALGLLTAHWFGYESAALEYTLLALDALMLLFALPASLVMLPVGYAAAYYLDMAPTNAAGIYLQTILLALLGFVQWFWLARFWSPSEAPMQRLNLA